LSHYFKRISRAVSTPAAVAFHQLPDSLFGGCF
jgi:hypothetical protein